LTIDQCQGKEADIVAISMVKKPTGFLNKNRLNVALSRVRRKLYFVADKNKFEEASQKSNWECFELAKDLLKLDLETRMSAMESLMAATEQDMAARMAASQQDMAARMAASQQDMAASQQDMAARTAATQHLLEQILARLQPI
jgi:hypothetical protein